MKIMNKTQVTLFVCLAFLVAAAGVAVQRVRACPFCNAAQQTLSQEIASADGAVIAQLVKPMPTAVPGQTIDPSTTSAKFRIVEVLRGEEKLAGAKELDVVYFGTDPPEKKFLITGLAAISPDKIDWTTPVPLSDRGVEYVRKLPGVPQAGVERLVFFQDYLEDEDRLLAQDAYDEFARAPYAEVVALGPHMKRDHVLKWVNDPRVGPSNRRLYLTMLGVCGQPADIPMLEKLLRFDYQLMKPGLAAAIGQACQVGPMVGAGLIDESIHAEERRTKESLDALIACYLKLKGAEGLQLVNEVYLGNPSTEYKYLHAAIMALRFHGEETKVLPREKLLESMRLALDHKEFADQVIPDLTRWEDWEVMPRLVKMFKESSADDWIRQPVASYVIVASEQPGEAGEKGKAALAELESLDKETVENARKLSAFSFLAQAAASKQSAAPAAAQAAVPAATPSTGPTQATAESKPAAADVSTPASVPAVNSATTADATPTALPAEQAAGKANSAPLAAAFSPPAAEALPAPSRVKIIGIPRVAALAMLGVFAVLLRGTDPRSSEETT
jgi:hypothetical protein